MYKMYDQALYENSCLAFLIQAECCYEKAGIRSCELLELFGKAAKTLVILNMVKIVISTLKFSPS